MMVLDDPADRVARIELYIPVSACDELLERLFENLGCVWLDRAQFLVGEVVLVGSLSGTAVQLGQILLGAEGAHYVAAKL